MTLFNNRTLRQSAATIVSLYALSGGQVVFAVLSTRWLAPEYRGQLVILLVTANLVAVFALGGLGIEGRRRLATASRKTKSDYRHSTLTVVGISICLSLFPGIFMLLWTGSLVSIWSIGLLVALSVSQSVMAQARSGLYGVRTYNAVMGASLLFSITITVGVCLLWLIDAVTYLSCALVYLAASIASGTLQYWRMTHQIQKSHGSRVGGWRMYRDSLRTLPGPVSTQFLASGDRLLLGLVAGPIAVAIYGAGVALNAVSSLLAKAIAQVIQTESAFTTRLRFGLEEWITISLTAFYSAALILTAPILTPLVFGASYEDAVPVTQITAITTFLFAIQNLQLARKQGSGENRSVTVNSVVGVCLGLILIPCLGYFFGAVGCAIAMAIVALVMCLTWGLPPLRKTA